MFNFSVSRGYLIIRSILFKHCLYHLSPWNVQLTIAMLLLFKLKNGFSMKQNIRFSFKIIKLNSPNSSQPKCWFVSFCFEALSNESSLRLRMKGKLSGRWTLAFERGFTPRPPSGPSCYNWNYGLGCTVTTTECVTDLYLQSQCWPLVRHLGQ